MLPITDLVRAFSSNEIDQARVTLYRDGFCVLRKAFAPRLIELLSDEIARLDAASSRGESNGSTFRVDERGQVLGAANLDVPSDLLFDFARSGSLISVVEGLFGGRCVPMLVELFAKPGLSSVPTPAHQDQVFYQIDFPNELGLTIWCPLADVGPDDAPLEYALPNAAPGQFLEHTSMLIAGTAAPALREPERFTFRAVPMLGGDLLAHHAFSIHRSAPNLGGRRRMAVGLSYRTSALRNWPRREVTAEMSPASSSDRSDLQNT